MKTAKTMKEYIRTVAALMIAGAAMTACSSDDALMEEQPVNPTEPKTYTMTVQATKSTGDNMETRGLSLDGKTLKTTWFEGEEVEVTQESKGAPTNPTSIGKLKAKASDSGTTTLTGTLTGLEEGKVLRFWLHNHVFNYEGQTGVLLKSQGENSIEEKYDFAMMMNTVEDYTVSGSTVSVATPLVFESMQAIVKFTLMDESGSAINAKSLKIECKNYFFEQMDFLNPTTNSHFTKKLTITPTTPTSVIYAAISHSTTSADDYTLTATTADNKNYTYTKSDVKFIAGKYYEVKVKMKKVNYTLAESTVGMIVDTDGNAYDLSVIGKLPTGVTAAGVVAYKNESNGLVIALDDDKDGELVERDAAIELAKNHSPKVTGYSWKLPSREEWEQMFKANGGSSDSYLGLNKTIEKAGGKPFPEDDSKGYWSSSIAEDGDYYHFETYQYAGFSYGEVGWWWAAKMARARACLAF